MRLFLKGFTFLFSVIVLSSVSTFASAKCSFDLRGTWQSYTLYGGGLYYAACTFSTDRDGNIESGSICDIYNANGTVFNEGLTAEGQYVTDDACNVTGSLSIGGGAGIVTILNARMSNGGALINGVNQITSGAVTETVTFTMFRLS